MINRTGFVGITDTMPSAAGAKADGGALRFEELLLENIPARDKTPGIISDRLGSVCDVDILADSMEYIIEALMSVGKGGRSIWEIVLQLEKHVGPELSAEELNMDPDETAGLNSVAGLLARFWKKKELLEESDTGFPELCDHDEADSKAASELADLLKKKEQKLIAEIHE